jgi:hypothetical protein
MRSTPLLLSGVAALALFATGCGSKTVDTKDLEGQLAEQLAPQAGVDAADLKVSCPNDQEVKAGRKFNCELTYQGEKRTIVVTLQDDEGKYSATVPPAKTQ